MRTSAVLFALILCSSPALAGTWDLSLERLCKIETTNGTRLDCGGGYSPALGDVATVHADNAAFRSLMSEMGVIFTPNILAPAETYGYNGFSFAAEFGFTTINAKKNTTHRIPASGSTPDESHVHRYWRAAQSVKSTAFSQGNIHSQAAIDRIDRELPPSVAPTITLMVRKGLWLPVPSFEIGFGARHLIDSSMWAGVVQAKVALHEGFQGWPVPALAVRGTGSRVFGTPGFNLAIAGLDFSMSKHLGVASTFNLMPYIGYQLLWIIADSEVLDATPGVDSIGASAAVANNPLERAQCLVPDCHANFAFDDQADILRHRFFLGIRANFYIVSFLLEYSYFAAGAESDMLHEGVGLGAVEVPDDSGAQHSVNFALSLDY